MRLTLLCCAAAILVTYVAGQQACDDTQPKCSSCENYGPQCEDCPKRTILSQNRESCLSCDTGCMKCTSDAQDVITCTECGSGYYLKNGACVECGAGCTECEEVNSVVTCKACQKEAYVQDPDTAGTPCVACPSNCKTCSLKDGATSCTECYNSLGVRGYYVKDGACKTCPTNCEKCRDDAGTVRCDTCIGTYMKFDDTADDTKDNTKCLACPATCKTCSGEALSGSTAKCTECAADQGVELLNDACTECTANCKNCDSDNAGQCLECDVDYRVEGGACTACPDNCKACTKDADTAVVSCDTCDSTWGEKATTSITCDKCTKSNCKTCALDGTCSVCKAGYYLDSGDCKTCSSGTDNCALCDNGAGTCTECASGFYKLSDDTCSAMPSNCITGDAGNADECTTCKTGYGLETGTTCTQCIANCDACDDAVDKCDDGSPDSCSEGYKRNADGSACVECTVDNCDKCTTDSETTTCTLCKAGYIVNSGDTACQACTANCATGQCTFDATAGATVGTCAQCVQYAAASGATPAVQGYVLNGNTCHRCPTGCADTTCTYNTDASKTECTTCAAGYIENADTKQCDKCETENCLDCELDAESGSVVCVDDQCESGYGRKADKLCHACPAYCSTCSVPAEATDDILICDTCEDSYVKNDKVCAKCPTNCNTCSNEQGTMTCLTCADGYALDSNKVCTKCPSNCDECSATGSLRCKTCATGYSLSEARDACVACATAAFANCAECTSTVNGTANCTECATGYTLKDEVEQGGECISTSGLSCGKGDIVDEPLECLTCESGWNLVDRKCARMCYACGDLKNRVGVDPAQCPTGGNMTGSAEEPELIPCFGQACVCVRDSDGKVACGCNTPEYSCDATDVEKGETCRTADGKEECARCCTEDKCNTFASALDGGNDFSGTSLTGASLILVTAAALLVHF